MVAYERVQHLRMSFAARKVLRAGANRGMDLRPDEADYTERQQRNSLRSVP